MVLKGLKGWAPLMLMPEWCTLHNTVFDIKCSKCKRTKENQFFVQRGKVYRTCNVCRDRARVGRLDSDFVASVRSPGSSVVLIRRVADVGGPGSTAVGATRHIPDSDTESESSSNPRAAPFNSRAALTALGFGYTDTDDVLLLSSSAAAASSSSSAGYFVDEPDPEPEPEGP